MPRRGFPRALKGALHRHRRRRERERERRDVRASVLTLLLFLLGLLVVVAVLVVVVRRLGGHGRRERARLRLSLVPRLLLHAKRLRVLQVEVVVPPGALPDLVVPLHLRVETRVVLLQLLRARRGVHLAAPAGHRPLRAALVHHRVLMHGERPALQRDFRVGFILEHASSLRDVHGVVHRRVRLLLTTNAGVLSEVLIILPLAEFHTSVAVKLHPAPALRVVVPLAEIRRAVVGPVVHAVAVHGAAAEVPVVPVAVREHEAPELIHLADVTHHALVVSAIAEHDGVPRVVAVERLGDLGRHLVAGNAAAARRTK
mmetsp:Transcript_3044/g.12141  ORF Transcript_3044/g.12141 Transcript_3044/m.12141 type:complete len:314 (+) Transcript_3044:417-1358(+)